jgi:hypothetical protein
MSVPQELVREVALTVLQIAKPASDDDAGQEGISLVPSTQILLQTLASHKGLPGGAAVEGTAEMSVGYQSSDRTGAYELLEDETILFQPNRSRGYNTLHRQATDDDDEDEI